MVARTLITTADERTWPKDRSDPVLFLGEWCRRYSRKKKWEQMDFEVVPYHWDDRRKLYNDYTYLQELYEELLVELADNLNELHKTDHDLIYWRILIGPWLSYFIEMLFDRWHMLRFAIENYEISKVYILRRDNNSVVPNDMSEFSDLFVKDEWNEALYSQLIDRCWGERIEIVEVSSGFQQSGVTTNRRNNGWIWRPIVERVLQHYNKLSSKNDRYFFISSYLPVDVELKVQGRLRQVPKLWRSHPVPKCEYKLDIRKCLFWGGESVDDNFSTVVRSFLLNHLPVDYLEGYLNLLKIPNKLRWPRSPQVIFTSNAYSADDVFKAWVAQKVQDGSRFIIGQHGGNFGMTPFASHEVHQIKIADKWLSWGWSEGNEKKVTPVGNFKSDGVNVKNNKDGPALLVSMALPRYSYYIYSVPIAGQWLQYHNDQKIFIEALPIKIRQSLLLRIYGKDYGWDQMLRWQSEMPGVRFDNNAVSFKNSISGCRVFIGTYNATTYLEAMTWNIPTIIYWRSEHWELKDEILPYFDDLNSVNIFHYSPEEAAEHLINVWDNIDAWWKSREVQEAREKFCHYFSKTNNSFLDDLVDILG